MLQAVEHLIGIAGQNEHIEILQLAVFDVGIENGGIGISHVIEEQPGPAFVGVASVEMLIHSHPQGLQRGHLGIGFFHRPDGGLGGIKDGSQFFDIPFHIEIMPGAGVDTPHREALGQKQIGCVIAPVLLGRDHIARRLGQGSEGDGIQSGEESEFSFHRSIRRDDLHAHVFRHGIAGGVKSGESILHIPGPEVVGIEGAGQQIHHDAHLGLGQGDHIGSLGISDGAH